MLIKKIDEMMIVKSSLKQQLTNTVQKEKEYLNEIDKVNQELDKTRQLLDKKDVENTNLKNELDKVRHNCNPNYTARHYKCL